MTEREAGDRTSGQIGEQRRHVTAQENVVGLPGFFGIQFLQEFDLPGREHGDRQTVAI